MSNPVYLSQSPSSNFPFVELKEDQHLEHLTQIPNEQAAASSTSFPRDHHYFAFTQDQRGKHFSGESHQTQHKVNTHDLGADISSVGHVTAPSSLTSPPGIDSSSRSDDGSVRWMATKVRLGIGKMVNYSATSTNRGTRSVVVQENSHEELNISSSNGSTVRVCSDCNTTKTPLWRSGPRGPKSLCNACGIRQRKARRAMVAPAEAASNGTVDVGATSSYKLENKEKKSRTSYHASQIKKQCTNITTTSPGNEKKINKFEDLAMISPSQNSASQRVFPRDVEEAAILLIALSCGLIHG